MQRRYTLPVPLYGRPGASTREQPCAIPGGSRPPARAHALKSRSGNSSVSDREKTAAHRTAVCDTQPLLSDRPGGKP